MTPTQTHKALTPAGKWVEGWFDYAYNDHPVIWFEQPSEEDSFVVVFPSTVELPFEYIIKQIDWFDVIVYQTTWTYEISHAIAEYLRNSNEKKIIVECYMSEPSFYRKPKGIVHDMYNWTCDHYSERVFSTIEYEKLKVKR